MKLYSIEYQTKIGQTFTCKIIGHDEKDIVNDLVSVLGEITILSLYYISDIHRISDSIRNNIIINSQINNKNKKIGRPRKYD